MTKYLTAFFVFTLILTPTTLKESNVKEHPVVSVKQIKVLTINTWGLPFNTSKAARLKAMCPQIIKLDADIVLLQELWEKSDYETIVKKCKYPYVTAYGPFPYIGKYSGMAILSKYPIVSTTRIDYRWRTLPNLVKAAMRAEILIAGRKISVFNTHLTANLEVSLGSESNLFGKIMFTSDHEERTRWDQLKTLTHYLNKARLRGHPVIVGGDLNTGPRYPLWYRWQKWLRKNYRDLHDSMSYTIGLPSTYNNDFCGQNQGQLDHIIAFGTAKVLESKVVLKKKHLMLYKYKYKKINLSDHFGVQSIIAVPY